ncbi:hypothetical protein HGRIS_004545 [Hohenbuehelia grisea]|uniref:DUF6533 domain-containing protein n=1 Tax=Hohenbuehelia grisea TaxID=104357 RepID=A0ABR3JCT0_9AGAR
MLSLEEVARGASVITLVKYLDLASAVVLVYDYALTLRLEVEYVWGHPWSAIQLLFYISRYLPFFDVTLSLISQFYGGLDEPTCSFLYKFSGNLFCFAIGLSEVALTMRTWSLYGRSRKAAFGLASFYIACWIPIVVYLQRFLQGAELRRLPMEGYSGCFLVSGNQYLSICWILLMVFDGGILLAMAHQACISDTTIKGSNLISTAYRDGIMYYIYIFILSTVNVVVILGLQRDLANLLSTLERAVHAALTCRVVLNLRLRAAQNTVFTDSFARQCGLDHGPTSPLVAPYELTPHTLRQRRQTIGGTPMPLLP